MYISYIYLLKAMTYVQRPVGLLVMTNSELLIDFLSKSDRIYLGPSFIFIQVEFKYANVSALTVLKLLH